jgi:predicted nucleic acid-binding protein
MSSLKPVIIDTNILFSALLRSQSTFAQTILGSEHSFYICESVIVELFKHKEKLVRLSHLTEEEIIRVLYTILRHVTISKEQLIEPSIREKAYGLCSDIDEADSPHVALALQLGGLLWTGDSKLKNGLRKKGFDAFFDPR